MNSLREHFAPVLAKLGLGVSTEPTEFTLPTTREDALSKRSVPPWATAECSVCKRFLRSTAACSCFACGAATCRTNACKQSHKMLHVIAQRKGASR